jgi:hypothetical protein
MFTKGEWTITLLIVKMCIEGILEKVILHVIKFISGRLMVLTDQSQQSIVLSGYPSFPPLVKLIATLYISRLGLRFLQIVHKRGVDHNTFNSKDVYRGDIGKGNITQGR